MIRELQESCLLKLLTRWLVTHSKQSTMKNGFSVKHYENTYQFNYESYVSSKSHRQLTLHLFIP